MTNPQDHSPLAMVHILRTGRGGQALDMACGTSVHNDPGRDLVSLLVQRIGSDPLLRDLLGIASSFKVQPVHRLDRETGGGILFSVTGPALQQLSTPLITELI